MTVTAVFIFICFALSQVVFLRGRSFHNDLVQRAESTFQPHGFVTVRECPLPLPDGRTDFVDLLAHRQL
ncbi:MAG: hypothetical protein GY953_29995, partial [bacterium]|nr:hypothetical protein [bacterium]